MSEAKDRLNNNPNPCFVFQFLGLLLSLSVLMAAISAQPLFLADPISTAAFTVGGGLVLTGASGATLATIPTASLLLGKALLAKKGKAASPYWQIT